MNQAQLAAFQDELTKIAVSVSDVGQFLTRTPYGGALAGAALGTGVGAGAGYLSARAQGLDKATQRRRALIGAGVGAGVGGLGGAAVGAARSLPTKKLLKAPDSIRPPASRTTASNFTATQPASAPVAKSLASGKGGNYDRLVELAGETLPGNRMASSRPTIVRDIANKRDYLRRARG